MGVVVGRGWGSCKKGEVLGKGFGGWVLKGLWIWEVMEVWERCGIKGRGEGKGEFWGLLWYGNEGVMVEKLISEREKEMEGVGDGGKEKEVEKVDWVMEEVGSWWEVVGGEEGVNVV